MDKNERVKIFRENLLKITREGGSGNFVIFEELVTKRFIQFAGKKDGENVLCDIPVSRLNKLSKDDTDKLVKMGFTKTSGKIETYDKRVKVEEAAELTEKVFIDIFNFSSTYGINIKLNLSDPKRLDKLSQEIEKIKLCFSDAKPSEVTDVYWIYARRRTRDYPKPTTRSGKWLIFVDPKNIDEVWTKIKEATEDGKLGGSAKVATAKPSPLAGGSEAKVICVYTYDWADEKDVKRIREELRKLGIINKIPYKTDEDTRSGKYQITGHKKISKYYE